MVGTTGFYAITCPDCEGRKYIDLTLCATCQGNGRILIPENSTVFHLKARHAIAITISAAVIILAAIAIAVTAR